MQINMDLLNSKSLGNNMWEIVCNTFQKDVIYYLFNRFIKSSDDSITDYQNDSKIHERVSEKTKELCLENKSLKSNLDMQKKDNLQKNNKIEALQESLNTLRENRSEDISQQVDKSLESKNELITELKNQNISLKLEKSDELKQQKEDYEARELLLREEIKELNNNNNNINNNKSSYEAGLIGEKKLLDLLREGNEFTVKDTHGTSHMGDAEILYNDFKLCIDAKQYKSTCPHKESTKLIEDVEKHNYDGGVLISWDSGIYDPQTSSKIKDLLFYKMINGKPFLFISYAATIPDSLIIKSIKDLSNNQLNSESLTIIQTNEKLKEEFSTMIVSQLKELDSSDKSHKIKLRRNDERRKHLNSILKEYNLSSINNSSSNINIVTEICDILTEIKQEYTSQRNSIRDIKTYIETYCEKHSKNYSKFTESDLKKALTQLTIESEKKHGKNYQGKQRKKDTITYAIELSPDHLN
jgi:hypothetical protein